MGFQILNDKNEPISVQNIDKEICILWNKKCHPKRYATPKPRSEYPEGRKGEIEYLRQINWFDSIGYAIHIKKCTTWDKVFVYFEELYDPIIREYKMELEEIIPEIMLVINNFKKKKYKPKYVKD